LKNLLAWLRDPVTEAVFTGIGAVVLAEAVLSAHRRIDAIERRQSLRAVHRA